MRIAISAELLNRLIPQRNPEYANVDDILLGLPVHGQSMTQTTVRVLLVPDPNRVLLALQITGRVSSLTSATSGPATFVNDTNSMYTAVKPLEIDLSGIRLGETEVEVYNKTTLRNVKTDFDGIPLVSQLAKGVARSQRDAKEPQLTQEVKEKVAAKARERIDAETTARFTRLAGRLEEKVFTPLDVLALEPAMIAAETTPQRVILRVRLAADEQLGSHTPRPQAPADSLASFQVHESVLNNMIERLALDGRTFTLPQLSRHIARCFGRPGPADDNPDHEDVSITFAPKDAVRVRCAEGRVEVSAVDRQARQGGALLEALPGPGLLSPPDQRPGRRAGPRRHHPTDRPAAEHRRADRAARGFLACFLEADALEAHARAARQRPPLRRHRDHAVCDRGRLDRRGLGGAARGLAAGRGAEVGVTRRPVPASRPPSRGAAGPGRSW